MQISRITTEQAQDNFNFYVKEIKECKKVSDVIQVGQIVIALQKKENGNYLFAKGQSKQFWDLYKETKTLIAKKEDKKSTKAAKAA